MKIQKKSIIALVILASLGVIAFLVFWVPSFFVDEYSYVNINYFNNVLSVTANPGDLFEKGVSRWTDVSATLKNDSLTECAVMLQGTTLKQSFSLAPGLEYGVVLPKHENISITFCGVKKEIRVN